MILKNLKGLLISLSLVAILLSSSAFSSIAYATETVDNPVTAQPNDATNKNTLDVKKLQHDLNVLFKVGLTEDNIKGKYTNAAIVKYGAILGSIDPTTLLQLAEQVLTFPSSKQGDSNAAVGYIQYRVGTTVDRKFGSITAGKIDVFQKSKNLTQNGAMDSSTWVKLME